MTITITITTDNAAFEDDKASEVARIVRDVASRIKAQGPTNHSLRDSNGNTVGRVVVEGDDDEDDGETCDECGEVIPMEGERTQDNHHAPSCSLHPDADTE